MVDGGPKRRGAGWARAVLEVERWPVGPAGEEMGSWPRKRKRWAGWGARLSSVVGEREVLVGWLGRKRGKDFPFYVSRKFVMEFKRN